MKAIEILKNIANGFVDFNYKKDCKEAIAELEALENRSCEGCKFNSSKTKTDELILYDRARGYVNQRNIIYCGRWSQNETN